MKSCLNQISGMYEKLSYSERILADRAIQNPEDVVRRPIAELSEALGIAPSTIVSAAKKLGFAGFKDFKLSLASETVNPISGVWNQPERADAQAENTFSRALMSNRTALEEMQKSMSPALFDQATDMLLTAKRIHIFGIGTSGILALELHDYLFRLGLDSVCYEDRHYQLLAASRASSLDVAVALSQSGVNRDIIELAEQLRGRGCPVIGLSNFSCTPFAKYTDLLLAPFRTLTQFHENNFSFRIPMLLMAETLYYMLADKMDAQYLSAMQENRDVVKKTSLYPPSETDPV